MPRAPHFLRSTATLLAALGIGTAHAGRPLSVDDAGTNPRGEGHVEAWVSRTAGMTSWNLSPAYAIADGVELSALASRDNSNRVTGTAVQLKWLLTPSREAGCNVGLSGGGTRSSGGGTSERAGFVNGILSCNGGLGSVHANLGATKPTGESARGTWGVALERPFGAVTPHLEWFGAEGSGPTLQLGARGDIGKSLQLDGTVGRSNDESLYSVGLKLRF
jgi:hypothetical protein